VTYDYAFKDYSEAEAKLRDDKPGAIYEKEPFQALIYEEAEPKEGLEGELQEYASNFCRDGELWIQSDELPESNKARCLDAVSDWLVLRRSSREESHILKINNIGVERDEKVKRDNVAKHCGLSMPKEFNH